MVRAYHVSILSDLVDTDGINEDSYTTFYVSNHSRRRGYIGDLLYLRRVYMVKGYMGNVVISQT